MIRKKTVFIAFILGLSAGLLITCGNNYSGEWVAKIDGDSVTSEELNTLYYAQHRHLLNITKDEIDRYSKEPDKLRQLPTLNKKLFLEELIKQRLVYNKAVKDGFLKNQELQAIIQIAKEGAVVQSYIKDKFKDELKITPEEIESEYIRNRNKLYQAVPIDQAENHIKQKLMMQKLQRSTMEFVENLKEQSRIEKNNEELNKLIGKKDEPKEESKENKTETK